MYSTEEPAQMVEGTQLPAASAPIGPDCLEWWSGLSVAVQKKWLANPSTSTIRDAWQERCKRQDAVNFARANVGLEGFKPSPEYEALAVRFINGEIELSEVIGTVKEEAKLR